MGPTGNPKGQSLGRFWWGALDTEAQTPLPSSLHVGIEGRLPRKLHLPLCLCHSIVCLSPVHLLLCFFSRSLQVMLSLSSLPDPLPRSLFLPVTYFCLLHLLSCSQSPSGHLCLSPSTAFLIHFSLPLWLPWSASAHPQPPASQILRDSSVCPSIPSRESASIGRS